MSMFNDPINSDKHVREPGEHARPILSHAREYFCVYPAYALPLNQNAIPPQFYYIIY